MVMESLSAFLHALRLHWVGLSSQQLALVVCALAELYMILFSPANCPMVTADCLQCQCHYAECTSWNPQVEFQNKFYHGDGIQFKPFTFAASDLEL